MITAVAIVAIYQGREADRQRNIAASRELAARASTFLDADPGLSLALAVRALDRGDTTQARNVLRQATLSSRALSAWPAHRDWVTSLEVSNGGERLTTAGRDGAVKVWDPAERQPAGGVDAHKGWAFGASLSPDGRHRRERRRGRHHRRVGRGDGREAGCRARADVEAPERRGVYSGRRPPSSCRRSTAGSA